MPYPKYEAANLQRYYHSRSKKFPAAREEPSQRALCLQSRTQSLSHVVRCYYNHSYSRPLASIVNGSSYAQPAQKSHAILHLQRAYGNRLTGQVLNMTRNGDRGHGTTLRKLKSGKRPERLQVKCMDAEAKPDIALQQTVNDTFVNKYFKTQPGRRYIQRNAEALWGQPDDEGRRDGYSLRPIAELWVQGRKLTTADFYGHSRLTADIYVPEDTRGIIQMRLQAHSFQVAGGGLVGPRRHDSPFRHRYLAEWRFDSTGDGVSLRFHRAQREIRTFHRETVTFSQDEQDSTLRIIFTARQDPVFSSTREMTRVVSLRVHRPVQIQIGPVSVEATLPVSPFAPDRARISPAMRSSVRRFYNSLNESTRHAIQANERPAGRMIVIEGYASTTGSQEHNDDLATARAVAVRDLLKQFSGNSRNDIFATPSFGESRSPTATDVRSREVEDPRYRKVVIRLWQQSGSGTTVTVPQ